MKMNRLPHMTAAAVQIVSTVLARLAKVEPARRASAQESRDAEMAQARLPSSNRAAMAQARLPSSNRAATAQAHLPSSNRAAMAQPPLSTMNQHAALAPSLLCPQAHSALPGVAPPLLAVHCEERRQLPVAEVPQERLVLHERPSVEETAVQPSWIHPRLPATFVVALLQRAGRRSLIQGGVRPPPLLSTARWQLLLRERQLTQPLQPQRPLRALARLRPEETRLPPSQSPRRQHSHSSRRPRAPAARRASSRGART